MGATSRWLGFVWALSRGAARAAQGCVGGVALGGALAAGCGAVLPEVSVGADALALPSSDTLRVSVSAGAERVERAWLALHMDAPARYALPADGATAFSLDLGDPAVSDALRPGGGRGVAFVFVAFASGVRVVSAPLPYTLSGVPERASRSPADAHQPSDEPLESLTLSGDTQTLRLPLRATSPLPGSRGRVLVSVGSVMDGALSTLVVRQDGGKLSSLQLARPGSSLRFYIGSTLYSLRVEAVADAPDDDAVTLTLYAGDVSTLPTAEAPTPPTTMAEPARRDALASMVEGSGATFIRNGEQHSAADAARLIRHKLASADPQLSLEDCILTHLSASTETGEPYAVWLPDGRAMPAAQWLLELAATIR